MRIIHASALSGACCVRCRPVWNEKPASRGNRGETSGAMRLASQVRSRPRSRRAVGRGTERSRPRSGSPLETPEHREAIEAEVVGQLADVAGPAFVAPRRVISAVPVPGPIRCDQPHSLVVGALGQSREPVPRAPEADPWNAITGAPSAAPHAIHAEVRPSAPDRTLPGIAHARMMPPMRRSRYRVNPRPTATPAW